VGGEGRCSCSPTRFGIGELSMAMPPYLMESPSEGERLQQKTDLSFAKANLQLAGLRLGMESIDVGCGIGLLTMLMHGTSGGAKTVGVDGSMARIETARSRASPVTDGIEFVNADVHRLPMDTDHFDFAWSRFVFEYLRDPSAVLKEMIRVTRPGGIVAVADLDSQLMNFHPQTASTRDGVQEAFQLLAQDGFDPWIGRKLFSMFKNQGMRQVKATAIPYQTYCGGLTPEAQNNWRLKLERATSRLSAIAPDGRWDEFAVRVMSEMLRDDCFYYSTLILVTGVK
jgi:ubiquinone/menaquinone biosynthesis C-methylase UbiE